MQNYNLINYSGSQIFIKKSCPFMIILLFVSIGTLDLLLANSFGFSLLYIYTFVPLFIIIVFWFIAIFSSNRFFTNINFDENNKTLTLLSNKNQEQITFSLSDIEYVNDERLYKGAQEYGTNIIIILKNGKKFVLCFDKHKDALSLKIGLGDFPKKKNLHLSYYIIGGFLLILLVISGFFVH